MFKVKKSGGDTPPIECGKTYTSSNGISWTYHSTQTYTPTGVRVRGYQDVCAGWTNAGPPYRSGKNVFILHWSDDLSLRSEGTFVSAVTGFRSKYIGGFLPVPHGFSDFGAGFDQGSLYSDGNSNGATLDSLSSAYPYGATGWKRFRPGNPTADLGVFLGEIRDVPRMLKGTASFFHNLWKSMGGSSTHFGPKRVADAWLNTQFGWLPFINDLRKFHKTYVSLDKRLSQIRRDNGRWVKRGGSVLDASDSRVVDNSTVYGAHWPSPPGKETRAGSTGNHTLSVVKTEKAWFEASFRYWIPDVQSVNWERRAIVELYGAMPCPALIWELTPFSWLADWVTNAGDCISNMSNGWAENLAAKYAYVMKTTEVACELSSTVYMKPFNGGDLHATWIFPVCWKTRSVASPFGFGLTGADFSARQWSILAALGIQYKA